MQINTHQQDYFENLSKQGIANLCSVIELSSSDGTVEEEVIGQRRKVSFMIEILDITTSQKKEQNI